MIVFYYTGTGNSLAVAKQIGGKLISISQIDDSQDLYFKADVIGVVFPVYLGAAPKRVTQFLKKAKFEADYTFAIATSGGWPGTAIYHLQKQTKHLFEYTNHIDMVDNSFSATTLDNVNEKFPPKVIEEMTERVVNDIHESKRMQVDIPVPWHVANVAMRPLERFILNPKNAQRFIVDDNCNKCGTCTKVCPAGNISISDKVNFDARCENCYACIHLCPKNAIHRKRERSNARWKHPEVSLKEIIVANNQRKINTQKV